MRLRLRRSGCGTADGGFHPGAARGEDYEALPEVSEAMVTLAMIRLMLHRLVQPNRKRLPAS